MMNIQKIIFAVLSLLIIPLLSACQDQTSQKQTMSQSTTPSQQNAYGSTLQQPDLLSAADQANFQNAMQLNDISSCHKIVDEKTKKTCLTALSDFQQLSLAMTQLDQKVCEKLSSKDQQEACKTRIEATQKESQVKKAEDDKIAAERKISEDIISSKEYLQCKDLLTENIKFDCEINILSNLSLQNKDIQWCEKGSTEQVKTFCKNLYNSNVAQ